MVKNYRDDIQILMQELKNMVSPEVVDFAALLGEDVEKYVPLPYNMEMVGVGLAGGVHVGDVLLANMFYEVTAYGHSVTNKACTSIVAETMNGTIYHGRNLDYSFTNVLRNIVITAEFQSGGKTVYTGTTFVGYIGLLTGQRPHAYTITLDERDQGDWWMNALEALAAGTHGIASFLIRDTLADQSLDFDAAIENLAYHPLIAPCYIIVGGCSAMQGAVITRNRIADLDIWRLKSFEGEWFLVETNYDHWEPPPKSDNRRDPAIKGMNETGRANLSPTSLFRVLSTPPVLNNSTTYTVTMAASVPELYNTWIRYP